MKKLIDYVEYAESDDWSFAGMSTKYLTHGFHPYPARMMPLIAKRIIEKYATHKDDVVLDPFCGSGTVLVEGITHNVKSIGFDINPLAILIAKAKTTPIDPNTLKDEIQGILNEIKRDKNLYPEPNDIPNLHYWFKPNIIKELSKIYHHIRQINDEKLYNFFATAFSHCVWKVSNVKKGEYKLYRMNKKDLEKWNPNVFKVFKYILYENLKGMREFYKVMKDKTAKAYVYLQDIRTSALEDEVSLILTSPPYGDSKTTVAYGQFSRYSALWLGLRGVLDVDKKSLGGVRYKGDVSGLGSETLKRIFDAVYKRDEARAWDLYSFFLDMDRALERLAKALRKGVSHMVFVIGNRTMRRVRIPTDIILIELSKRYGFKHIKTIYREIPTKRIPWENAPENISGLKSKTINKESIIIWKY